MYASYNMFVGYITELKDKKGYLRKVIYTVCIKFIESFMSYEFTNIKNKSF